jgi:membrane-associated phospholipid phosphatase
MVGQRHGGRLYNGVFRLLEAIGVKNTRTRWESQSPFLQRAIPPLVIAALVILLMLPFRAPDPAAIVLLAIVYALYIMPRRWRKWALPVTVLAIAVAYPFLIQQSNYQRFLFEVPIFNSFPSIDTMAVMAIFAMMAVGLNKRHNVRSDSYPCSWFVFFNYFVCTFVRFD